MKKTWEVAESTGDAFVFINWSFRKVKSVGDFTEDIWRGCFCQLHNWRGEQCSDVTPLASRYRIVAGPEPTENT